MVEDMVEHEAAHLADIRALKAAGRSQP